MEPKNKKKLKLNKKALMIAIGVAILIIFMIIASCYLISTKNQRLVRRSENPWNIQTEKNVGQLIQSALKNPKYVEGKDYVKVTGKDVETGADIEFTFIIGTDKTFALSSYKKGISEMTLAQFVTYIEKYA